MHSSVFTRGAAVAAAVALVGLTAAPATAASVSQASSSAVSVDLAGTAHVDSGTFEATYDGNKTQTSGTSKPGLGVLTGQTLISGGVLRQEADATTKNGKSYSEACAGLVGDGTGTVGVGSGTCLGGNGTVTLDLGNLDLDQLRPAKSALFQGWDDKVANQVSSVRGPIAKAFDSAVAKATGAAGRPSLNIDLRAAESSCATLGQSSAADARIENGTAYVTLPVNGKVVPLVSLPAHPEANHKVVANLGPLVAGIVSAVRTELLKTLGKVLSPALALNQKVLNQVTDQLLGRVRDAFAPLQENVLSLTLNKQDTTKKGIEATAIDLNVLPAAANVLKTHIAHVAIGQSICGPNRPDAVAAAANDNAPSGLNVGAHAADGTKGGLGVTAHPQGAPASADVHLMSSKAKAGIGAVVALAVLAAAAVLTRLYMVRRRAAA